LTKKVTLQNLFHDGGFSNMGISTAIMDELTKGNQINNESNNDKEKQSKK
jgi:enoyl-[acyl-carrier protein] reductase I